MVRFVSAGEARWGEYVGLWSGRCGALRYVTLCCGKNWFGLAGEASWVQLGYGTVGQARRGLVSHVTLG